MKHLSKRSTLCAAAAAAGLALGACGQNGADGAAGRATAIGGASGTELADVQVLRWGNNSEPQSLDPHRTTGVPESNIQRDLFEGLIATAANGDLVPGAAESWVISEDGKTYTFSLRPDGRWSNGDPVTAHDFVYALRRSVDPATGSFYAFILAPIRNADAITAGDRPADSLGVEALDDYTLEIELENPTPYFLGLLSHHASYPLHRSSLEQHGNRFTRPGNLISNGAYVLEQWAVQSHVKLRRNPHYWDDGSTVIDEVFYYTTEDLSAELKRYRADELDISYDRLPESQMSWIRDNLGQELVIAPYLGSYYFGFNTQKPPFKDNPALRKALTLAIDREIITTQVVKSGQLPAFGWVPPVANYTPQQIPEGAWTQAEREAEAQRLYAEAGYSRAEPVQVEILYNTEENHKAVAVAVAAMWSQVLGVKTSIRNQEWKAFLDTRNQRELTQVFRGGWIGDYNDAYTFAELFLSTSGLNNAGYDNPEYDRLVRLASAEQDSDQRARYLEQAERVLLEDLPLMPVYFYVTARLIKPWVAGYESNIMNFHPTKHLSILEH